LLGSTRQRE